MALNGGRVGRPVFFFSTQQIDLPVGTSARRRNSSRQLTLTFVQSSEGRLGLIEWRAASRSRRDAGRRATDSLGLANSDARPASALECSVVPVRYIQQLYLSPRPLSRSSVYSISLSTYVLLTKGFMTSWRP